MENRTTVTRRTVVRAAGAVLASLGLAGSMAARAHAVPALNFQVPLSGTITSTVGPLQVSGTVHVVIIQTPTDPIIPPNPVRVHTNLVNVTLAGHGDSWPLGGAQATELASRALTARSS